MSDEGLSEEETNVGMKYVLRQGLAGHAMGTLAGGVFMVKIALSLGASLFVIGLLAALPSLAQLAQIPATYLIERYRNRKRIAFIGLGSVRLCIFSIALIPLAVPGLLTPAGGLSLLLALIVLQGLFSATGGTAWNSWIRDVVPEDRMGSFFSRRQQLTLLLGIPLSLGAAAFLEEWVGRHPETELHGYSILFFVGMAAGVLGLYFLLRVPEPEMSPRDGSTNFVGLMTEPFREESFRHLIQFMGTWNFAIALAAPFFTVYLLQRLEYGMPFVIAMGVLSQLVNAAFAPIWGRLSDAYSNKTVLQVSGPLVLVSVVLWLFTAMPQKHGFTLPLLVVIHVLLGMSMSGVSLATGNIGMKLAPRGRATSYLAATGFVGSLAAGVGPLLGGAIAGAMVQYRLTLALDFEGPAGVISVPAFHVTGIDFAFLLTLLVGVYAMHRLTLVVEAGRGDRSAVARSLLVEVKRPLLTFTTIGGWADVIYFPVGVLRDRRRRNQAADYED